MIEAMHNPSILEPPISKINDRIWFFKHNGHKIMWTDFSKSGPEQMITLFEQAFEANRNESPLKVLANFKSTPRCPELTKKIRESGKWFHKQGVDVKVAVIGVDNVFTSVVINTIMTISRLKKIRLFENGEAALKWLST